MKIPSSAVAPLCRSNVSFSLRGNETVETTDLLWSSYRDCDVSPPDRLGNHHRHTWIPEGNRSKQLSLPHRQLEDWLNIPFQALKGASARREQINQESRGEASQRNFENTQGAINKVSYPSQSRAWWAFLRLILTFQVSKPSGQFWTRTIPVKQSYVPFTSQEEKLSWI